MPKDRNGRLKRISNFILLLFGVNGVICVSTTILGLLTDRRILGTFNIAYIEELNRFLWNIQFFRVLSKYLKQNYCPTLKSVSCEGELYHEVACPGKIGERT